MGLDKFLVPPINGRGMTVNHRHTFSASPAGGSEIIDTDVVTPPVPTVEASSKSSSTHIAPKSIAASYLLAAISAWANACRKLTQSVINLGWKGKRAR